MLLVLNHLHDVQLFQADEEIAVAAVHGRGRAARVGARRRLGIVEVLAEQKLGRY